MKENNFTYTTSIVGENIKPIQLEDIEKAFKILEESKPKVQPNRVTWFEKFMNKLGWYRYGKVVVVDSQRLKPLHSYTELSNLKDKKK